MSNVNASARASVAAIANGQPRRFTQTLSFVFVVVLAIVLIAAVLVYAHNLNLFILGLLIVALTTPFPISYIAYSNFQNAIQLDRLADAFVLLGEGGTLGQVAEDEAFAKAKSEAQKRYNQFYNPLNFALNILLCVILSAVGALLLFFPASALVIFDDQTLEAVRYGFLGAYLFSVQLIYRRYTTYDLQPGVYFSGALTMIAGLIFNYTAFRAVADVVQATSGDGNLGLGAIIAFALGYFPTLAIRWFNRLAYNALSESRRRADELPLSLIDGISQWHETRLRDNGIDNVQNLAAADLLDLLVNTTFGVHQVMDWVGQAILYLHLDGHLIVKFRENGVRTISDFHLLWRKAVAEEGQTPGDQKVLETLAEQLGGSMALLQKLSDMTELGPNIHYIEIYWKNLSRLTAVKTSVAKYEDLLQRAASYLEYRVDEQSRRIDYALSPEWLSEERKVIDDLLKLMVSPKTALPLIGWGVRSWYAREWDQARRYFERALSLKDDPNHALAHAHLGIIQIEDFDAAKKHLDCAIQSQPRDAALYYWLGYACYRDYKYEEAIAAYQEALTLDPDFRDARENLALAYMDLGDKLLRDGAFDRAADAYKNVLEKTNPDPLIEALVASSLAWLNAVKRGLNPERERERAAGAVELLERSFGDGRVPDFYRVKLNANLADIHEKVGDALRDKRQFARAAASYRRAIDANPGLASAHNALARLLLDTAEHDTSYSLREVFTLAERAVALSEQAADYADPSYLVTLADVQMALGQWEDAQASLDRALESPRTDDSVRAAVAERVQTLQALRARAPRPEPAGGGDDDDHPPDGGAPRAEPAAPAAPQDEPAAPAAPPDEDRDESQE